MQVTPERHEEAFEAQYAEKIRCRMILVDTQHKAMAIWEELHKNPGGFEKIAMEQSMDTGSRSLGGLLAEPITRHAYPQTISDAAFQQLVDGDPDDKDPSHKPKDGSFTGPIQVSEMVWVILRRESLIPADQRRQPEGRASSQADLRDDLRGQAQGDDGAIIQELIKAAAIENQLTGTVKLANEEKHPAYGVDGRRQADVEPAAHARRLPSRLPARAASAAARARWRPRSGCRRRPFSEFEKINRPNRRASARPTPSSSRHAQHARLRHRTEVTRSTREPELATTSRSIAPPRAGRDRDRTLASDRLRAGPYSRLCPALAR